MVLYYGIEQSLMLLSIVAYFQFNFPVNKYAYFNILNCLMFISRIGEETLHVDI